MQFRDKMYQQSPWLLHHQKIREDYHLNNLAKMKYIWKEKPFLDHHFEEGVYLVTGPRQIGKSTHMKLLIEKSLTEKNHKNILYFNCDFLEHKQEIADLIISFEENIADRSKNMLIILDEITSVKDGILGVKYLLDSGYGKNVVFILTGSSTVNLEKTGEYLPGRRGKGKNFILSPLSLQDIAKMISPNRWPKSPSLTSKHLASHYQELTHQFDLPGLFEGYAIAGGFPKTINEWFSTKRIAPETLMGYRDWIISEIAKNRRNTDICKLIFERLAKSLTTPISYHAFVQDSNLGSHNTAHDYLHFFEQSFLIDPCYHYDVHRKRVNFRKNKKIYWSDPLIFWIIDQWISAKEIQDYAAFRDPVMRSHVVENMVANLIKKRKKNLFYYQNSGEIDFVDEGLAIEVKYQSHIIPHDYATLTKIPNRWKKFVVSQDKLETKDGVHIIPADLFLLAF